MKRFDFSVFWSATKAVFRKEVMDARRDRRFLLSLLSLLIGPLLFPFLIDQKIEQQTRGAAEAEVWVLGHQHAVGVVGALEEDGIVLHRVNPAEGSSPTGRQIAQKGKSRVVLEIPENFSAEFRRGASPKVRLFADTSDGKARPYLARIRAVLMTYSQKLAALRLMSRGSVPRLQTRLAFRWCAWTSPAAAQERFSGPCRFLS